MDPVPHRPEDGAVVRAADRSIRRTAARSPGISTGACRGRAHAGAARAPHHMAMRSSSRRARGALDEVLRQFVVLSSGRARQLRNCHIVNHSSSNRRRCAYDLTPERRRPPHARDRRQEPARHAVREVAPRGEGEELAEGRQELDDRVVARTRRRRRGSRRRRTCRARPRGSRRGSCFFGAWLGPSLRALRASAGVWCVPPKGSLAELVVSGRRAGSCGWKPIVRVAGAPRAARAGAETMLGS